MVCSLLHVVVSLEVKAVHCVVYGKSGAYVHLHSIVNVYVCTVCDNITSSFRFYEMKRKLNTFFVVETPSFYTKWTDGSRTIRR